MSIENQSDSGKNSAFCSKSQALKFFPEYVTGTRTVSSPPRQIMNRSSSSARALTVNEDLLDAPESINEDPYGAWFVRVGEVTEVAELLDDEAYAAHCEQEA